LSFVGHQNLVGGLAAFQVRLQLVHTFIALSEAQAAHTATFRAIAPASRLGDDVELGELGAGDALGAADRTEHAAASTASALTATATTPTRPDPIRSDPIRSDPGGA
jgi:hypothetical protein